MAACMAKNQLAVTVLLITMPHVGEVPGKFLVHGHVAGVDAFEIEP